MARRWCATCEIGFPEGTIHMVCPVCEQRTDHQYHPHDLDWQHKALKAADGRRRGRFQGFGLAAETVERLMDSAVSSEELRRLIEDGCDPEVAAHILI